uniref:Uncharacterized protein n=1 Tax=Homalodisca liturata TaxID=320908 RepID=A0A1B6IEL8_9HEMI
MLDIVVFIVFCLGANSTPIDWNNANQIESSEIAGENIEVLPKNSEYVYMEDEGNRNEIEEMNSEVKANSDEEKDSGEEGEVGNRNVDVGSEDNKYEGVFGGLPEENGHSKREKRFEADALDLTNLLDNYDDKAAKYEGVFGGYPQDIGLGKRVKRSLDF